MDQQALPDAERAFDDLRLEVNLVEPDIAIPEILNFNQLLPAFVRETAGTVISSPSSTLETTHQIAITTMFNEEGRGPANRLDIVRTERLTGIVSADVSDLNEFPAPDRELVRANTQTFSISRENLAAGYDQLSLYPRRNTFPGLKTNTNPYFNPLVFNETNFRVPFADFFDRLRDVFAGRGNA